jgi:hypothetical protein
MWQSGLPQASALEHAAAACEFSQEVANGLLGNAILEVGVYATEGDLLSPVAACLLDGVAVKLPIVPVIMLDSNAVLGGVLLKGTFEDTYFC